MNTFSRLEVFRSRFKNKRFYRLASYCLLADAGLTNKSNN